MSTHQLRTLLDDVEHALKKNLKEGEVLKHRHRGRCVYTDTCAYMETRCGSIDSLYVEIDGQLQEVTLILVERDAPRDWTVRMQEETPELLQAIDLGRRVLNLDKITNTEPVMAEIQSNIRNLYFSEN